MLNYFLSLWFHFFFVIKSTDQEIKFSSVTLFHLILSSLQLSLSLRLLNRLPDLSFESKENKKKNYKLGKQCIKWRSVYITCQVNFPFYFNCNFFFIILFSFDWFHDFWVSLYIPLCFASFFIIIIVLVSFLSDFFDWFISEMKQLFHQNKFHG